MTTMSVATTTTWRRLEVSPDAPTKRYYWSTETKPLSARRSGEYIYVKIDERGDFVHVRLLP